MQVEDKETSHVGRTVVVPEASSKSGLWNPFSGFRRVDVDRQHCAEMDQDVDRDLGDRNER